MFNPEQYSANNQYHLEIVEQFFNNHGEKIRKEFKGKKIDVLDIGSGCGRILNEAFVTKSGLNLSKVVGVDKGEDMVKFANEKYGSDSMSFYVMDAGKEIPEILKNRKFDLITSFFCLHWISDYNVAFKNIQSFLKPNGIFCCIFSQLSKSTIGSLIEPKDDFTRNFFNILPKFQLFINPCEVIEKHLNDNDMKIIYIDELDYVVKLENLDPAKGVGDSVSSNISALPENEKLEFFEKLFELFEMKFEDGMFVFKLRNISFIAKKQMIMSNL